MTGNHRAICLWKRQVRNMLPGPSDTFPPQSHQTNPVSHLILQPFKPFFLAL